MQESGCKTVVSYVKQTFDYKTNWKKISDDGLPLEVTEISDTVVEKYVGKYQVKDAFMFEVYSHDVKIYGSVQGDSRER